jgi:hypothetical protein
MWRAMRTLFMPAVVALTIATVQAPSTSGEFRKFVGQTKTICGRVVSYDYPGKDGTGDCSLRLDIGAPYSKAVFYAFVKSETGSVPVPEPFLANQICVTGLVESDKKRTPFIAVGSSSNIDVRDTVSSPPFGGGAARTCEAGIVAPKLTQQVRANYPADEFRQRTEAKNYQSELVSLQAVVAEDGSVRECRTVYAMSASFAREAEAAVRRWRFTPARRDGKPVAVIVVADVTFDYR